MEKFTFLEKQERVITSSNGKVLLLLNGQERKMTMPDGEGQQEKTVKQWEYDGVWLDGVTSANDLLGAAKRLMVQEITTYDSSPSVNGFMLNGQRVWLNKDTRVGLMNSTNIAKGMGKTTTTLWFGGMKIEVNCDKAIGLLSALEMYALECFNVTAAHKKAVAELNTVEEVLEYDYTKGYPEQLRMEVSL